MKLRIRKFWMIAILASAVTGVDLNAAPPASAPLIAVPEKNTGAADAPLLFDYNAKSFTPQRKASCHISHDGRGIIFEAELPHRPGYQPAALTERDGTLWINDRIEVFLQPYGKGAFYQFIVNAAGTLYDGKGYDKNWNSHPEIATEIAADCTRIRLRVPFEQIGYDPTKGELKGNIIAASSEPNHKFLLSWAPMYVNFMDAPAFGKFVLSSAKQPFVKRFDVAPVQYAFDGASITAQYAVADAAKESIVTQKLPLSSKAMATVNFQLKNAFSYQAKIANEFFPDVELHAASMKQFSVTINNTGKIGRFADRFSLNVDGKKVISCSLSEVAKQNVDIAGWPPGNHRFEYVFRNADGKIYSRFEQTILTFKEEKSDYDISQLDASRYYPAVKFDGRQFHAARSVFDFSAGLLPRQITVNGMPLLARPFQIVFDGKPLATGNKVQVVTANKNQVKLRSVNRIGDKTLTIDAACEYDGFVWYEISLKSERDFEYGPLTAEALLHLDKDVMMSCNSLYPDELFNQAKITDTGAPTDMKTPGYGVKYVGKGRLMGEKEHTFIPLTPYASLSTDTDAKYRGLGIAPEGPVGWNLSNYDRAFEIIRNGPDAQLNMRIGDGKKRFLTREIKFAFGIQPFPLRIPRKDFHRDYRIDCSFWPQAWAPFPKVKPGKPANFIEKIVAAGATMEQCHENWTSMQGYWAPGAMAQNLDKYVAAARKVNLGLIFYCGFLISNLAPEFPLYHDLLLRWPNAYPGQGFRPYLYYHQGDPDQDSWPVCYRSIWGDRFCAGIDKTMRRYNARGLYFDGTLIPSGCANALHGCGVVDPYGRRVVTFAVRAYRRMGEMLYNDGLKRRPDFIMDMHVNWPMPPVMSLLEGYFAGETSMMFDPGARTPPNMLRSDFNGALYGIPCDTLRRPEIRLDTLYAQALLVDSFPRFCVGGGEKHIRPQQLVWGLYDTYKLTSDTFTPYWIKANKIVKDNPAVFVSYYETPKVLIAVVSAYWSPQDQRVTLDFRAFHGLRPQLRDVWSNRDYTLNDGKLTLTVGAKSLALLKLEKR